MSESSRDRFCSTTGITVCCRREASTKRATSASSTKARSSSATGARAPLAGTSRALISASPTAWSTWPGKAARNSARRLVSAAIASPSCNLSATDLALRSAPSSAASAASTQRSISDDDRKTASCRARLIKGLWVLTACMNRKELPPPIRANGARRDGHLPYFIACRARRSHDSARQGAEKSQLCQLWRTVASASNIGSTGTCSAVTRWLVLPARPTMASNSACWAALMPLARAAALCECTQ